MQQRGFVNDAMASVATTSDQCSSTEAPQDYRNAFRVADISVGFRSSLESDVAMDRPLVLFRSQCQPVDIDVEVEWVSTLGSGGAQLFDSGATWRLYQNDRGFQFDFSAPFFGAEPYKRLSVDAGFTRGILEMNAGCAVRSCFPGMALSYPLDELLIMHRLTQEKAIEMHGSGIVRANGVGNLFIGHSGAGKSTTTRLWTERENVEVLSDDRIIVRHDPSSPTHTRMYGTPWHGEAMYASPNSAPLARIFVLEHGHGNVITPLTPSQGVAELFARSFVPFHRHEYVDSALAFLEELSNAVPVYRYAFEPDQRAVEKIRNFHD
jgi:hypothetical protein